MMDIQIQQKDLLTSTGDLLVVPLFKGASLPPVGSAINKMLDGALADVLKQDAFESGFGESLVFPTLGKLKAKKLLILGMGERSTFDIDSVRRLGAVMIRRARDAKAKHVITMLPGVGVNGISARDAAEAFGEGAWLGAYRFHAYKGKPETHGKDDVKSVTICETERVKIAPEEKGLAEARVLSDATHLSRDLVNTPSAEMHPSRLAEIAQGLAQRGSGITVKTITAEEMRKLGMHAALAVGKGSVHEPIGIHLVYRPANAKKKIAIIGKAVTFDSGGLSLKPADSMTTMKCDMAGSASVIGLFKALPSLGVNVEVHGIFLAVENMPSGEAYRPGDVVKAMNGTTIEVLNTDAEGRVTLADALSYAASRIKPDVMIDVATLTGACVVALGEDMAALMTNDRKLGDRLLSASKLAGEPLWELPLYATYNDLIKSRVADIKNTGGRYGGAITAGLFLQHFVGKVPWAHLDIAGPAYTERETRYDMPYGGTGYGVRLLARYLQAL